MQLFSHWSEMLPLMCVRGTLHSKVTWTYNYYYETKEKILGLVTGVGDLCVSFPILSSIFCLQVSSNTSTNLLSLGMEIFVGWWCVLCGNLWRVMLSVWNAWDTHLGPYVPCSEPVLRLHQALEVVLMIASCSQQQPLGKFNKIRFITHRPWSPPRKVA